MPDKRNKNGTFAKGNKGGTGNPYARRVAAIRVKMMEAVTDEDIDAVIQKLVSDAKDGDLAATKELLNRLVGKPASSPPPDELDQHEATVEADCAAAKQRVKTEKKDRQFFDNMFPDI